MRPPHRPVLKTLAVIGAVGLAVVAGPAGIAVATSPEPPTTPTTPVVNPDPPQSTTNAAEGLTQTGATLTASVNPRGAETTYRFEYGTATAYGLTTASATLPAGTEPVAVKVPVSGLTASTTYHFRVVATNAAGTTNGADRTFSTLGLPRRPSVATRAPAPLGTTDATLTGRVNPQGQDTTVKFEWGTSTKYGRSTPSQPAGAGGETITVTSPISGLKANTKYYFRTVATNKTGTSRSSSRSFTTGRGLSGVILNLSSPTIAWNGSVSLGGNVGGSAPGGVTLGLMRQDHPYTGPFREIATTKTASSGAYGFTVKGIYNSVRLQVVPKGVAATPSPVVSLGANVLATLRVTKRKAKTVRLSGTILPGDLPKGARVSIQRQTPKGRWTRVARPELTRSATGKLRFAATVKRLSANRTYRALVLPADAGAHVETPSPTVSVPKKKR